jgi:two-component system, sensor histidine kinase and response regulator
VSEASSPSDRGGPPTADPGKAGPRPRVLIVEDDEVNQRVAAFLVEKRGFSPAVVATGEAAVEAVLAEPFAAVLMDCQMPGFDGFAATARIRELEPPGRRTPIIAMTANTNPGARERCLSSGMDDYVAKPITGDDLDRVFRRHTAAAPAASTPPPSRPPPRPSAPPPPPIDWGVLDRLRSLQTPGAPDVVAEVVGLFLDVAPGRLEALRAAAASFDLQEVGRLAHALKGSAVHVGAHGLARACFRLEELARDASSAAPLVDDPGPLIRLVGVELERVQKALSERTGAAG